MESETNDQQPGVGGLLLQAAIAHVESEICAAESAVFYERSEISRFTALLATAPKPEKRLSAARELARSRLLKAIERLTIYQEISRRLV